MSSGTARAGCHNSLPAQREYVVGHDGNCGISGVNMRNSVNHQTKTTGRRLGDQSNGLATNDLAIASKVSQTPSDSASKTTRLDRNGWHVKVKALGKQPRSQTTSEFNTLTLPTVLPEVRRDVHKAVSQFAKEPADLLELLFQDVTLATSVLSAVQFHAPALRDQPPKNLPDSLKHDPFTLAIHKMKLQAICEALDEAEMDAPALTKLNKPWMLRWWRHAMAVSQLSGELATAMEVDADLARMAGFFHDIGRLVLLSSRSGAKLISAYETTPLMDITTAYAEHTLLGMDHHQAGAAYCTKWKLPQAIHDICMQHDLDDTMRQQLDNPAQRLAAVVNAADQIAKSVGLGSLEDDELRPLPGCMQPAATELTSTINQTIAQIQTMCYWRTGHSGVDPIPAHASLTGKLVMYVSSAAGPWNPITRMFNRADAQVSSFSDIKQVILNCPMSDLMVLDFTTSSLHLAMPVLARLVKAKCFANIPKLLIANAAEDPHSRIKQSGLDIKVLQTPIRGIAMLQSARAMLD